MASRSRAAPRQATYAPKLPSAPAVTEKRKPVFTKVDRLQPGTSGHNLTVKVVNSKDVPMNARANRATLPSKAMLSPPPGRVSRIAECLIGDETGSIIFTARNEQGPYFVHEFLLMLDLQYCLLLISMWKWSCYLE